MLKAFPPVSTSGANRTVLDASLKREGIYYVSSILCGSSTRITSTQVNQLGKGSDAVDRMNDRYGEFVITPATMKGMDKVIIDRILFGHSRELEDLYASA